MPSQKVVQHQISEASTKQNFGYNNIRTPPPISNTNSQYYPVYQPFFASNSRPYSQYQQGTLYTAQ
jgi:hypothetical protein